jgi:hypothetical protein
MTDLLDDVEAAAGLTVFGAGSVPGASEARDQLVADGVPGLLAEKDPTLWGEAAEPEAKIRLGWVDTHRHSRELLPQLAEIRGEMRRLGLDHVELTVLDTTDALQVGRALADRLDRTVVVVASKSGSTVETDSHRRVYLKAFEDANLAEIGKRFVIVTDPGSPLEAIAREMGAHVVPADPEVGGRYSALTAFGLVPSALAGVNVEELLDQAEDLSQSLRGGAGNPALALGAALGAAARAGRDKVALSTDGSGIVGLGDWAEQLLAESTGKEGLGILPVVLETPAAFGNEGVDVLAATLGGALQVGNPPGGGSTPAIAVNGPLGAQFLTWEFATAIAGRILGINPFDQPNVAESKENTNRILESGLPQQSPSFVDGSIEVYGETSATSVADALTELVGALVPGGYLAVMAYLDRVGDADTEQVRALLASRTDRAVTFGWGPRFLHSTGQYHKGGPQNGSFLQITGAAATDLEVPGKPYTFVQLQAAQAAGDRQALGGRGRPLLHLHLTDRQSGVAQLLAALGG